MIPRYTPAEIGTIFSEETRLQRWLQIELLACEAWAAQGVVPREALPKLRKATIDVDRWRELEREQEHDLAAFVAMLQESLGEEGRYLHYGLTSSDIVDTSLALEMRDAAAVIDADLKELEQALTAQALTHRTTVMAGRTHGVHAEPITLGVKLANHLDEVRRSRARLTAATAEIAVGQLSGAVGTHATVPAEIEEHVCKGLGLAVAPVTTQVIARDRHAAFICALALVGSVLERLATMVRLEQITEVDELAEPFSQKQKGSSAMPHKRNPILSERICGLARLLRGNAATAMEDVALWHERDISHSSAERVIIPDSCATASYITRLATRVVSGLRVNWEKMRSDVDHLGGIVSSQRVLSALISDAGWPREQAYRTVQALAAQARETGGSFRELVQSSGEIRRALDDRVLARCFDITDALARIDVTYVRLGLQSGGTAEAAPAVSEPATADN